MVSANASSFQVINGSDSGCSQNPDGTWHSNSGNNFFNCAALLQPNADSLVAQRGYVFGNLPVAISSIRNPGYINEDFAIIKNTTLFETHTLTFKVDLPNAFNRHVFGRRDGNIFSNTFGVPGGGGHNVLNAPRKIQLTLRYQF